jgi:hypothetical protein
MTITGRPASFLQVWQPCSFIRLRDVEYVLGSEPGRVSGIRLEAPRVLNGAALGRFADLANAVMLNADDDISPEAKRAVAALFDYIRDLLDVGDDASYSDKLEYHGSPESMLHELEEMETAAYSAFRHVKLTGENWPNKTPLQLTIGYLTVVPAQKALDGMFVPRRVRLG